MGGDEVVLLQTSHTSQHLVLQWQPKGILLCWNAQWMLILNPR